MWEDEISWRRGFAGRDATADIPAMRALQSKKTRRITVRALARACSGVACPT